MAIGKEFAFNSIRERYKELFGIELDADTYKYIMKGYCNGVKEGMRNKLVVRLSSLGSLQPSKSRLKLNTIKNPVKKVVEEKGSTYICGVKENDSHSFLKPKYYVNSNRQATGEETREENS